MPPLLFAPRTTAAAPKLPRLRLHLLPRDRLRPATRHEDRLAARLDSPHTFFPVLRAASPDAELLSSAACPTVAARPIDALGICALDKP